MSKVSPFPIQGKRPHTPNSPRPDALVPTRKWFYYLCMSQVAAEIRLTKIFSRSEATQNNSLCRNSTPRLIQMAADLARSLVLNSLLAVGDIKKQ